MNRRTLLFGSSALALAGCATGTDPTVVSAQVVTDINLIASGLQPILPQLSPVVSAAVLATVSGYITQIQAAAAAVAPGVVYAAAVPSVTTIVNAFSSILSALSGVGLPGVVTAILAAVQALLPVVEIAIGMVVAVAASPARMTPERARLVLGKA